MWLIVGLGNPGPKYELTRHNIGFLVADALLDKVGVSTKGGFSGQCARFDLANHACLLLKPETFMNRSGIAVQQAMAFHKIPLDHVIVIHDELDLPMGQMRIKRGGGDGGHNGLKDISRLLGPDYYRLRIGIGRSEIKGLEADYVLSPMRDAEIKEFEQLLPKALQAIEAIITHGLEKAQAEHQIKKL
jgi:PTH1 family peptidyl-tRNA hydrolase